jgi:hypothetical protein
MERLLVVGQGGIESHFLLLERRSALINQPLEELAGRKFRQ